MVKGTNTQSILGVVLAGGKSSRMGTDKAQLPFRGKTLLDFQFEKLASIFGMENTVVSGNYPHLPHVLDDKMGLGPLGGIISLINKPYEYFVFLPVDMPNLSKRALINLMDFAKNDSSSNCWTYKDFQMPLIIRNQLNLSELLEIIIEGPVKDRSIRFLIQKLQSNILDPGELGKDEFLNTNTILEWQEVYL